MADQNIRVRVSSNNSATRYFYVRVYDGNGDNGSYWIYVGNTNSSGSQISTSEFSTSKLHNGQSGYSRQYQELEIWWSTSAVTLNSNLREWNWPGSSVTSAKLCHIDASYCYNQDIVSDAYYLDITFPSSDPNTTGWGSWTQRDSSDNELDTTGPASMTATFAGSTNTSVKLVFDERVGDSSGNKWTASTFPSSGYGGISWSPSNSAITNFTVDSVTYSTTTNTDDTVTLGISYDGSVGSSETLSFTIDKSSVYDQYGNVAGSSGNYFSSGALNWPTTGSSGRTYYDRTFKLTNSSSAAVYFLIGVDSNEGTNGGSYVQRGPLAAGQTASYTVSQELMNDFEYSGYGSFSIYAFSSDQSSNLGSSFNPSGTAASITSAQLNAATDGRLEYTWDGSSWTGPTVYDTNGNLVDLSVSSPTITFANSGGSGTCTIDYGEKVYKSSTYGPSSFSQLSELVTSDVDSTYVSRSSGDTEVSSVSITGLSYDTSDDSGAMAIYGTDSTSNSYGTGWFYPVYTSDPGSSHQHTFSQYGSTVFYMPNSGSNHAQSQPPAGYVHYHDQIVISFTYSGEASTDDTMQIYLSSSTVSGGNIYDANLNSRSISISGSMQSDSSETASEDISSSGGTVTTSGGSITIPSDALSSTTTIGMSVSDTSTVASTFQNISINQAYSPVVSLTPHGQTFDSAVTVSFDISGSSAGSCPSDLKVFKRANASGTWYEVPSSLWSCSSGTISLSTTQFSQYQAIGGQNMALTRKDARQLRKITLENKINPRSIDLIGDGIDYTETGSDSSGNHLSFVGSMAAAGDIDASDLFIIADVDESTDAKTKKVTAGVLQDFFSSVDVTDKPSDTGEHRILFVDAGSGSLLSASLEMDSAGITFNPSTDTLTLAGALVAASLDISGDIDVDGTTNLDAVDIDGAVQADGTITVGASEDGYDVKFFGNGAGKSLLWDESEDSLVITGDAADALKVAGGVDIDGVMNVGEDDTGYDVKFFGDTASAYMLWDASADDLILGGAAGLIVPDGQLSLGSTAVTSTAAELNKLDGASADVTAAKLSTLSALTDAEIGYLDGATSANSAGSKVVVLDSSGNLALPGNLTISGTTTTVDTTNLLVEDKNVELGVVDTPTDTTADGGGITLKGATDKTFNWVNSTDSWTSSEHMDLASGKELKIAGTKVLDATSLGSAVVSSSLTSVGALAGGSIASGFGNIDNGSSTLNTGAATVASLNASSGGITNAGAISGASTIAASGEISAASLDISGNVDIDGTANLDDVDIDGAVQVDGAITVGVDDTGYDVKFFGETASAYMMWDASADDLILAGAAGLSVAGNIDVDGTANLDAVDIDGAVQADGTITVGEDDTGYDVKFFGATSGAYMLWDESDDDLKLVGAAGLIVPDGQLTLGSTAVSADASELNLLDAGTSASSVALASGDALIIGDADASNASKKVLVSDMSAFLAGDGIIQDSSSKKLEIVPVKLMAFGANDSVISAIASGEAGYSEGYRHKMSVGTSSSQNFPMKETLQVFVNGQLMTMHATDGSGDNFDGNFSASEDAADYAYVEPTSSAAGVVRFKDGVIKFDDDVVSVHYLRKV